MVGSCAQVRLTHAAIAQNKMQRASISECRLSVSWPNSTETVTRQLVTDSSVALSSLGRQETHSGYTRQATQARSTNFGEETEANVYFLGSKVVLVARSALTTRRIH